MFTVDLHAHHLPPNLPDFGAQLGYQGPGAFIHLKDRPGGGKDMWQGDRFFRRVNPNAYDVDARLAELDAHGVDVMVVCTVPVLFNSWVDDPQVALHMARYLNDDIMEGVRRHPTRFIALGALPMQFPELAVQELERCVTELGMPGVQISSNVNGRNLSDSAFFPIFQRAAELGAAIFVHPWDIMAQDQLERYWLPWLVGMPAEVSRAACSLILGGVLERLPTLRIGLAHAGGSFLFTLARIEHGYKVRPDLVAIDCPKPPSAYLDRLYVDYLTHDPATLRHVLQLMGPDRVCLGTDYPFPLGEWLDGHWRPGDLLAELPELDAPTLAKLRAENAFRFLGLDPEPYRQAAQGR